ncbi:isochorismate synthase [Rhabdothermincola salaria]|uniref:isochorismate synthase n=1 Tax=Rhabdothermincola salaria TaxID=2903142 RepID=UPI001E620331|nr:isochorismate synthase [Rhabdothermincola salaria]
MARTRLLDVDPDLIAVAADDGVVFVRDRVGVAGVGVAARIRVPRTGGADDAGAVTEALGAITHDDPVHHAGSGPVAIGALPFEPTRPGALVVPRITVGRADDGTRWVTTVTPPDDACSTEEVDAVLARGLATGTGFGRDAGSSRADEGPGSYTLRATVAPAEWCDTVAEATTRLRAGVARKVVLARAVEVSTDRPLRASVLLGQLRRSYPTSHLFSVEGFVGATPELLVARAGDRVLAHPMAGTAPRSGDPSADARLAAGLLASTNTRDEHRHTIDMVHDTLLPWCSYLDEEAEPQIVAMANVQHLATRLEGRLSSPPASVLELVGALHPTPAVGGSPRDVALDLIAELEDLDRGRYAGPVGWVDAAGNGTWAVGIRSAELHGTTARLYAGVGVVADSDPAAELAETRAKLQALLSAVVRP